MNCALCGSEDVEPPGALCPACDRLSSFFTRTLDGKTRDDSTGPASGLPPPGTSFAPGQSFGGRYTVVELVGAGGMGQVYKAIDRQLNRTVALKIVRPGLQARLGALQRFRRELALAQQVTHPNVCRVHDLGEVEGELYITMEFVTGQTLDDLIRSMGHLSPRQTIAIGRQVCAGLQAIHDRSIVHRDLKPGNIMVDRGGHAVVMDFGMALHHGDDRLTSEGSVLGTLAYLSPEHARGQETDVRSDIYALGVIFFEMLSGRRPPGDEAPLPLALREASQRCPPPSQFIPEVPAALDAIVLRCLQREPSLRFPTASELEQAFTHAAAGLSTTLLPAAPPTELHPVSPRRVPRWLVVAGLAVAAGALAALVARVVRPAGPSGPPSSVTIALLPLDYDGPPESAYLKDVLPKALGDGLDQYERLEIAPFASSRTFGPREEPKTVAAQLDVGNVIHGAVGIEGEDVTVRLHLWRDQGRSTRQLERRTRLTNVFAEADGLAREIADAFGVRPQKIVTRRDPRALAAYLRGQTFLEGWDVERNYTKAEASFTEALQADNAFAEAHAGLALAIWRRYQQTQDTSLVEPALAAAQRAAELSPHLPEAHLALGVILLGRGRSVEAAASFEEARRLAPADDAACRQIARAYYNLKRNDEAERLYDEAIALRPSYWENYNAKALFCMRTGKHAEAKSLYAKVIELRPLGFAGYTNKAVVHLQDGEFKEAEHLLRAALQINPATEARGNLGYVLYAQGRYGEAAAEYEAAVRAGANRADVLGSLADTYRQAGRLKEARATYARAIELAEARLQVDPADNLMRAGLAMFLAGSRRCPPATTQAAQAVAGAQVEPRVQYYAAVAAALCGDRGSAVRRLQKALQGGMRADVRTNPDLASVRKDPSIRALLR